MEDGKGHGVSSNGLRHYDAILVIHRYDFIGLSGDGLGANVAYLYRRRQEKALQIVKRLDKILIS